MKTFTRRDFLKFMGIGAAGVSAAVMTACGSDSSSDTSSTGSSTASGSTGSSTGSSTSAETAAPAPSDERYTFTFAITGDVATLDQSGSTGTQNLTMCLSLVSETLLHHVYNEDTNDYSYVVSDESIAESLEWNEDNTVATVKIRDGIQCVDGTVLDGEDVKNALIVQAGASGLKYVDVDNIVADGNTVTVPFTAYNAVNNVGLSAAAVFSKEAYEASDDADFFSGTAYASCGPYKITEWVAGDHMTFERNENYWRANSTNIDTVVLRFIAEASVSMMELETGGINMIAYPAQDYIDAVNNGDYGDQFVISSCPGIYAHSIFFNMSNEYTSNYLVRKAICMAIDRRAIYEAAFNSNGYFVWTLGTSMFEGQTTYNEDTWPIPYDVEGAKELMKEAGYENGFTITLLGDNDSARDLMAQMLKKQLAEIGITLEIEEYDNATFISNSATTDHWAFFVRRMGYTTNAPNFIQMIGATYLKIDMEAPENAELVDYLDKCSTTADDAQRLQYLAEFEEKWWDEYLIWYPVQQMELTCIYNSNIIGFNRVQDDLYLVDAYFA